MSKKIEEIDKKSAVPAQKIEKSAQIHLRVDPNLKKFYELKAQEKGLSLAAYLTLLLNSLKNQRDLNIIVDFLK
jgi:predicted HicB family RNase H-like nuclease